MSAQRPMSRRQQKLRLYKLALARSDFAVCRKACGVLLENVQGFDHPLYFHLYSSAVIAYAKPFVQSKSGPLPSQWKKFEHSWMLGIHDDAIRARHEVIAHNDDQVRKIWIVPPGAASPEIIEGPISGLSFKIETYYVPGGFFSALFQLCDYQIYRLNSAIEEDLESLYGGREIPAEEFLLTFDDEL